MPPAPSVRRLYRYSGRVQGVGFRYTVRNIALRYDVTGYVRNLPDGRVECCIEGPSQAVDDMAGEIAQKMEGFVRDVKVEDHPAGGGGREFEIRR